MSMAERQPPDVRDPEGELIDWERFSVDDGDTAAPVAALCWADPDGWRGLAVFDARGRQIQRFQARCPDGEDWRASVRRLAALLSIERWEHYRCEHV